MGLGEGGEGEKGRKERGGNTKPLTQWENTTIQRRQAETNPVQHCPVQLAALYYSQLAISSSAVLVLFLKDNFTFHLLSSETLLKVPACYYEQKSSANAEMLYPLLLPPCHRWIAKHSVIKKENICWECSIPFQQQALHVEETPRVLHSERWGAALPRLLCPYSAPFRFLPSAPRSRQVSAVPATLVPSARQGGTRARPSEGKGDAAARTKENQVIFTHLKIPKQTRKDCSTQSAVKLLRPMLLPAAWANWSRWGSQDGSPCEDWAGRATRGLPPSLSQMPGGTSPLPSHPPSSRHILSIHLSSSSQDLMVYVCVAFPRLYSLWGQEHAVICVCQVPCKRMAKCVCFQPLICFSKG